MGSAESERLRGRYLRLVTDLEGEVATLESLGTLVETWRPSLADEADAARTAWIAVKVHGWYTGLENTLRRVERSFGTEPSGEEWHRELLAGAVRDIPGLRPPILPPDALDDLQEILKFRHFFRNAYAVDLDPTKIARVSDRLLQVRVPVHLALSDFIAFLQGAAAALAPASPGAGEGEDGDR